MRVHPRYDARDITAYFDVAVAELDEEVEFSRVIRPVCLPTEGDGYWGDLLRGATFTVQGEKGGRVIPMEDGVMLTEDGVMLMGDTCRVVLMKDSSRTCFCLSLRMERSGKGDEPGGKETETETRKDHIKQVRKKR